MISIIIPCYWKDKELFDMTIKCLDSLYELKHPEEVIVVDDGSPYIGEISYADVIKREENGGYSLSVNTGVANSKGDTIIIGNNDMVFVDPNWMEELLKPLEEGYSISTILVTDSDGWVTSDKYEEDAKFGSILAMKRETWNELGGFDPYFKGYFADLDMRRKALNAGMKIVKNHRALVDHAGKATYKSADKEDREFFEMRERYMEKWGFIE